MYFVRWLKGEHASKCQAVSGGAKCINFWKLEGATLVKKQGRFGRKTKQSPLLCGANLLSKDEKGGQSCWSFVVGTSTGSILSFTDREVQSGADKAHAGTISLYFDISISLYRSYLSQCCVVQWKASPYLLPHLPHPTIT